VEVRIGIPVFLGLPKDWECPFALVEAGHEPELDVAYGIDAFQALINALEGVRIALVKTGRPLTWLDFERGFTGFTRLIHFTFGLESVREIEALVEETYERHGYEAAAGKRGRPYQAP
jgi:hypothetical protein